MEFNFVIRVVFIKNNYNFYEFLMESSLRYLLRLPDHINLLENIEKNLGTSESEFALSCNNFIHKTILSYLLSLIHNISKNIFVSLPKFEELKRRFYDFGQRKT